MKYLEIGGARVSRIGVGTWQFGSTDWGYGRAYADEVAPAIVHRALDLGVTLFDTAEIYGYGRSEQILGRALGERRSEAFIASKLFPVAPLGPVVPARVRGSLRRLATDVLDLYQVHWPNPLVPIGLTMDALRPLCEDGTLGHLGVSNFSLSKWKAAEEALGAPVLSNQVKFSLLDRAPERHLVPWAVAEERIVIAYSPLSQGLLSGRYGPDNLPTGMRSHTPAFLRENVARLAPVLAEVDAVARTHDATSAQVALAWLLRRPNVVVIPGASSVAQAEANIAAADLELTDDEDAALSAAVDDFEPVTGLPAYGAVARESAGRLARRLRRAVDGLGR